MQVPAEKQITDSSHKPRMLAVGVAQRVLHPLPTSERVPGSGMQLFRKRAKGRKTAALPPPRNGFVDLDRRFGKLHRTGDRDSAADDSYLYQRWSGRARLDWEGLLKQPLVILLGEQGSGKAGKSNIKPHALLPLTSMPSTSDLRN